MQKRIIYLALGIIVFVSGCYIMPPPQPMTAPEPAPAPTSTLQGDRDRMEWVPIVLRAKGGGAPPEKAINPAQARLMTERAAKMDAYRNLLEQAYGLNISSKSTVKNFVTQNDVIRSRVDAYIRGAKVVDTQHLEDGGVEVEMEVTLGHDFRKIFP